jgi:tetratricopeptide (TPR) repeat protein
VLIHEGDFERAVQEANTVVSMAPYDAFALVEMAEVMTVSGLYEQALDWLTISEARDPTRAARYHRDRAYVYRLMGRYEESVREYTCAGFLRPWFRLSLAIDYVRLGRLEEARAAVKELLKVDPKFTLEMWRHGCHHKDPAVREAEIVDLARAGLPER